MTENRERVRTARRFQEVAGYRVEAIVPQFKLIQGLGTEVTTACTQEQVARSGLQLVAPRVATVEPLPARKRPMRVEPAGWRDAVRVVNARAGMWHWLSL